jgi:hypothetical protein
MVKMSQRPENNDCDVIEDVVTKLEHEIKVDSYGLQSFASSSDFNQEISINTFVSSSEKNKVEDVALSKLENKQDSEGFEINELQREKNKQKKTKNKLISQNTSIFSYAQSCPNCKKSFNSHLVKRKVIHFKSCCNSKNRWVEEQVLEIMIEDLKYRFRPEMEKRKQDKNDYDSSIELSKDLETKKIYYYFPVEKSNIGSKKDVSDIVKNEEDSDGFLSNSRKSLNKQLGTKRIKVEADDIF